MNTYMLAACLAVGLVAAVRAEERPNVIIINVDNHEKGELGFYGNRFIETPNLDRLFRDGLRFENYHISGRCTSSRSELLTGRYPSALVKLRLFSVCLVFSTDNGRTWTDPTSVDATPYSGYTSVASLGPGELLIAFGVRDWLNPQTGKRENQLRMARVHYQPKS